jgi:hypothetical protein
LRSAAAIRANTPVGFSLRGVLYIGFPFCFSVGSFISVFLFLLFLFELLAPVLGSHRRPHNRALTDFALPVNALATVMVAFGGMLEANSFV